PRSSRSTSASATAGPCSSPMAMARLRATTGVGATASSWSYRATICGQSVCWRVWGVGVHGVDGRLQLVRTGLVAAKAPAEDRLALGDHRPVLSGAVLLAQHHERAVRP